MYFTSSHESDTPQPVGLADFQGQMRQETAAQPCKIRSPSPWQHTQGIRDGDMPCCAADLSCSVADLVSCAAQQHRFTYNEPMPVESCTQSLCDLALQFGEDDEEGGMVSARVDCALARCFDVMLMVSCNDM